MGVVYSLLKTLQTYDKIESNLPYGPAGEPSEQESFIRH